jgi:hypothetical protein
LVRSRFMFVDKPGHNAQVVTRSSTDPRLSVSGLGRVKWWLVGAVMFAATLIAIQAIGTNPGDLTKDTATVSGGRPWYGLFSQLGLIVWGAAAGACIAAALVCRAAGAPSEGVLFMASTAAFTALVAVDDALLLHEDLFPRYLGVPEIVVKLVLCLVALAWLVRFRAAIVESDLLLFGFAVLFLGASLVADAALEPVGLPIAVEDFFKYVGLAAFASWCFSAARRLLQSDVHALREQTPA